MSERPQRIARRRGTNWTTVCALPLLMVVVLGLIPRLLRAERRALVASCPIAYVGVDGRIHLTNVDGTIDIELEGPNADGRIWFIGSPPAWSPDGEMIAYMHEWRTDARRIAVTEPGTGMHWQLESEKGNAHFGGWLCDGVLHEVHLGFRHARSGTLLRRLLPPGLDFHTLHVAPAPPSLGSGAVSVGPRSVELRGKQFRALRALAENPDGASRPWVPKVDAAGTWLGWTSARATPARFARLIGVARIDGETQGAPHFVGLQFADCVFCDWSDEGNILANVREQKQPGQQGWRLAILDGDGTLLRRVPTDVPPAPESGASWRRARPTDR